jgi:hypothetical protein
MTRYRNTTTGETWNEDELTASLVEQIAGLDEDSYLGQDVKLRENAVIREYVTECALVGLYESVDDEWP